MFNSKSFDLNNEEFSRQPESLYQPQKIRWLKYIIQPSAIVFVVILILWNVDFSNDQQQVKSVFDLADFNTSKTILSLKESDWNPVPFLDNAEWCKTTCTSQQSFYCASNLRHLVSGPQQARIRTDCEHNLLLRLTNNQFPKGFIKSDIFNGEYRLQTLILINCTLIHINDDDFDQKGLHTLINLELVNVRISKITKNAFRGLNKLSNFTLMNNRSSLRCEGFMTPLSNTLYSAKIYLQYAKHAIYKPEYFFGDANYTHLKVLDLRGNNIGNTVESSSFKRMRALEYLILAKCRLSSIHFDVNKGDLGTLRYLDLSGNMLKEISNQFLFDSIEKGIQLNLENNNWECSYSTFDLFKSFKITPCIKSRNLIGTDVTDSSDSSEDNYSTSSPTKATTKQQAPARTTKSSSSVIPVTSTISITETMSTTQTPQTTDWKTTETTESINNNNDFFDHIICVNDANETISNISFPHIARIQIVDESNSAVDVIFSQLSSNFWTLIYFSNSTLPAEINKTGGFELLGDTTVRINYLSCATAYVFCLLIEDKLTSPFNCQSHQTMACNIFSKWFDEHLLLIVSGAIVGILLCITFGLFAMYGVLWMRPTWLCKSKRLIRSARESHTMILLPMSYKKELYDSIGYPTSEGNINEYVAYYRHLEQEKLCRGESNKYNIPPLECAPSVPQSGEKSTRSTNPNTYTYECFELYEELF